MKKSNSRNEFPKIHLLIIRKYNNNLHIKKGNCQKPIIQIVKIGIYMQS